MEWMLQHKKATRILVYLTILIVVSMYQVYMLGYMTSDDPTLSPVPPVTLVVQSQPGLNEAIPFIPSPTYVATKP